jgi:hypothetical protein
MYFLFLVVALFFSSDQLSNLTCIIIRIILPYISFILLIIVIFFIIILADCSLCSLIILVLHRMANGEDSFSFLWKIMKSCKYLFLLCL